jgi:hypothetical protein
MHVGILGDLGHSPFQRNPPLVVAVFDDGVFYNWLAPLGAAIGHCYSPYLKFKGGKAVACYMGLIGGTSWPGFILCWLAFMPIFLGKKIVSIASLISGGILCVFEWLMYVLVQLRRNERDALPMELRLWRRAQLRLGAGKRCHLDLHHAGYPPRGEHQAPLRKAKKPPWFGLVNN